MEGLDNDIESEDTHVRILLAGNTPPSLPDVL